MARKWRPYQKEEPAQRFCDALNNSNRRSNMVGSVYDVEKRDDGWVVNHYVLRQLSDVYGEDGRLEPWEEPA